MLLYLIAAVAAYVLLVVIVNRNNSPEPITKLVTHGEPSASEVSSPLTLVSWNLGYAGLGKDANFAADGGTDYLPKSREQVESNLAAIMERLQSFEADVFLLQEVAGASLINRHVDVKASVKNGLSDFQNAYSPDTQTLLIPWPAAIDIGKMTLSEAAAASTQAVTLPLEPVFYLGILRKNYQMLVSRFPVQGSTSELVVINIHLAAFDDDAAVRISQVKRVLEYAQRAYAEGDYVVVGGDWNLRLVTTDFRHSTSEEFLFWLADMPADMIPEEWKVVADNQTPSVRTLHKSYVPSENYTAVIDGFVVSPNVRVLDCQTIDLEFEHSDHNPTQIKILLEPVFNKNLGEMP